MAHLVRQQITYYADAAGKRVPKGTPGAKKVKGKASKWYGVGVPGLPPKKRVPLATDKAAAKRMLDDMVRQAERGSAGLPARGHEFRPLAPLVDEFGQAVGRRSGERHTRAVLVNVRKVLDGVRAATVADLAAKDLATRVEAFVWGLTKGADAVAPATAAYAGKHARQFTRWLWRKRGVLDFDPLAGVDLPSQEATQKRRPLDAEELARLIGAADGSARTVKKLPGPDRAMVYLVAVATGYRAGELARLTPASFDLDADVPVARLPGRRTKNRKAAEQPIPPAVVARLRGYLAGRPADAPVWPGLWYRRAADMLRVDMAAAGIPELVDDEAALFHSLRHSYATLLAQTAPVKVVQELARHSTPVLTIGRYSHAGMREKAEAVARLPLPGAAAAAGPFAALTRADLEAVAETLLAVAAVLLTPPLTPAAESEPDGPRPPETVPAAGRPPAG